MKVIPGKEIEYAQLKSRYTAQGLEGVEIIRALQDLTMTVEMQNRRFGNNVADLFDDEVRHWSERHSMMKLDEFAEVLFLTFQFWDHGQQVLSDGPEVYSVVYEIILREKMNALKEINA